MRDNINKQILQLRYRTDDIPENYTGIIHYTHCELIEYYKNGRLHNNIGPARIWNEHNICEYWLNNKLIVNKDIIKLIRLGNMIS